MLLVIALAASLDTGVLCEASKKAVLGRLKAPATAQFPSCVWSINEYKFVASKDGKTYWAFGHVDSQNGFGALIRAQWGVVFERKGNKLLVTRVVIEQM